MIEEASLDRRGAPARRRLLGMSSAAAIAPEAPERYHWTRQAFHRAVDAGAFGGDDVLLRHGEVVRRVSPKGTRHAAALMRLNAATVVRLARSGGAHLVRVQDPIARTDDDEPEPDLAIVVAGDYELYHPRPEEIVLVVEVADSSFAIDRRKLAEYAEVGIPQAWIVDVVRRRVLVHRDPDPARGEYTDVATFTQGTLSVAGIEVAVSEIFPAPRS